LKTDLYPYSAFIQLNTKTIGYIYFSSVAVARELSKMGRDFCLFRIRPIFLWRCGLFILFGSILVSIVIKSYHIESPLEITRMPNNVQVNLLRYGNYCGPGPDLLLPNNPDPIDPIDELCKLHDEAYQICGDNLSLDSGRNISPVLNQLMPIRFLFPSIFLSILHGNSKKYLKCMYDADKVFVTGCDDLAASFKLPKWWFVDNDGDKTDICHACVLKIVDICIISAEQYFFIWTGIFRKSINHDTNIFSF
jgi:hypothetical protein